MAEINVKITEINNAITKLQNLQKRCNYADAKAPTTVGGGWTVNELETMADVYKKINISFGEMIANTISFLRNVEDSYDASDKKAAKHIGGGGSTGGTGASR